MNRLLLRTLNAPIFVLLVALSVAIQSSLFRSEFLSILQPDFVVIAVIWCGLRRSFTEAAILTLIFGEIAEIHSSSPQGILTLCYVGVLLLSMASLKLLVLKGRRSWVLVSLIGSVLWKGLFLGLLYLLDLIDNQWRHTLILLIPGALSTAGFSYVLFRYLEKFDDWSWKSEKVRNAIEGDLLLADIDDDDED